MKIIAAFDGTKYSEAILPTLLKMAALPTAEFILLSVAHEPTVKARRSRRIRPLVTTDALGRATPVVVNQTEPSFAEDKGQAIDRRLDELDIYLTTVVARLPELTPTHIEAHISDDPAATIIERARADNADVIVMATHSPTGLKHALFGSVAEAVVRSGVAPVLLVHPAGATQT
jgi:nucleotide-binding universal stress UspA family protein